jgi:hypothetical protein
VIDFIDSLRDADSTDPFAFPLYYDDDGAPVPADVLYALDADDNEALTSMGAAFLPERFKRRIPTEALEQASTQTSGTPETTESISDTRPEDQQATNT